MAKKSNGLSDEGQVEVIRANQRVKDYQSGKYGQRGSSSAISKHKEANAAAKKDAGPRKVAMPKAAPASKGLEYYGSKDRKRTVEDAIKKAGG